MAPNKKAKGGKGGGKSGGKPGNKPPPKQGKQQGDMRGEAQLAPQDRVDAVRPFWESLPQSEREKLLCVSLDELRNVAREADNARGQQLSSVPDGVGGEEVTEPTLEEVLDEGVRRLKDRGTWKLWSWMATDEEFFDAETFRNHVTEKHIRMELRKLLPRDDPKSPETPAEEAFRQRMVALLQRVQQTDRAADEPAGNLPANGNAGVGDKNAGNGPRHAYRRRQVTDQVQAARDANVELINIMLEALEKEHECIYNSLLQPVASFVTEVLPKGMRESTTTELAFEDLERLSLDAAAMIVEWLTEKVDALSTKLKADPKDEDVDEDDENMGDVDLWSVVGDSADQLSVNEKWLAHLQARLLGEDGHPRKARPGEDEHKCGLVLEWVFGSIVSTAEKARDGAKRCLASYMPTAAEAHLNLLRALEDMYVWDTRSKQAKEIMSEMVKVRMEVLQLAETYDMRSIATARVGAADEAAAAPAARAGSADGRAAASGTGADAALVPAGAAASPIPDAELPPLPNHAVLLMLRRELLLTRAKLHHLMFQRHQQEGIVRTLKAQLRQGEPEFERLKRELDEVKSAHRGLDGTYRSAAEMERHRAQLADAAIEEQLEVQTAFRELGARLQSTYDRKQRTEYEMVKRENESKQLQGWKATVESIYEKFVDVLSASKGGLEAALAPRLPRLAATDDAASGATATPGDVEAGGGGGCADFAALEEMRELELSPQQCMQLAKLRTHFHMDLRKQLYCDDDHKQLFEWLKAEVKAIDKRLDESRVALQHLEMQLLNTACDDPGAVIGMQLALPLLQERLDKRALEFAAERAKMAEDEILRMEQAQAAREAAERERKVKAKQSKKDKARSEKEKAAAAAAAAAAEEEQRRAADEAERRAAEEAARAARAAALEAARRDEEAEMERRRQELLSDENGYWRRRMEAEARAAEAVALCDEDGEQASATAPARTAEEPSANGFMAGRRGKPRVGKSSGGGIGSGGSGSGGEDATSVRSRGVGCDADLRKRADQDTPVAAQQAQPAGRPQAHAQTLRAQTPGVQDRPAGVAGAAAMPAVPQAAAKSDTKAEPTPPPGPHASNGAGVLPTAPQTPPQASSPKANCHTAAAAGATPAPALAAAVRPQPPPDGQHHATPPQSAARPVVVPIVTTPGSPSPVPALPPGAAPHLVPGSAPMMHSGLPMGMPMPAGPAQPPMGMHAPMVAGPLMVAGPGARPSMAHSPPSHMPMGHMRPGMGPQGMGMHMGLPMSMGMHSPGPGMMPAANGPMPGSHLMGPNGPMPMPMMMYPGHPGMVPPHMMPMHGMHGGHLPHGMMHSPPLSTGGSGMQPSQQAGRVAAKPKASLSAGAKPFVPSSTTCSAAQSGPKATPHQPLLNAGAQQQQHRRQSSAPSSAQQPAAAARPSEAVAGTAAPSASAAAPSGARGQALDDGTPPVRTAPRGGSGPEGSSAGCCPRSPLTVLDNAEASDGSVATDGHEPTDEAAAAACGVGSASRRPPQDAAATAGGGGAAASAGVQLAQSRSVASELSAGSGGSSNGGDGPSKQHSCDLARGSDGASATAPLAAALAASPTSSGGNMAGFGGSSWKQKLQQNLTSGAVHTQTASARGSRAAVPGTSKPSASSQPSPSTAPQLVAAAPLRAGSCTSARAMADPVKPLPGVLSKLPAGRVAYAPRGGEPSPLRLARGLLNRETQNNCFLNVIVQALWHLPCFREPLLRAVPALPAGGAACTDVSSGGGGCSVAPKDAAVLDALRRIFVQLAEPDEPTPGAAAAQGAAASGAVSPVALRCALSQHPGMRVDASDMEDANEIFGELLAILHRAEVGPPADAAADVQLPVRVRVTPGAQPSDPAPRAHGAPASLVHRVFGIDVQQPCPPDDGNDADATRRSAATRSNSSRRGGSPSSPGGLGSDAGGAAAVGSEASPASAMVPAREALEVQQFTKFFHLIPAQGLREVCSSRPLAWFEELIVGVEAACGQPARAQQPLTTLLQLPLVFTLAIVWESPQAPKDAIRGTVEALGEELDLSQVFCVTGTGASPPACRHRLRSVLCYFKHHYSVFAHNEETGQWLLFDDEDVQLVGQWADVARAMVNKRLQPSLLFYERAA